MSQSKKITDGALLMAIYIMLLIMSVFIPAFILIGLFILPIPFIMYAARYNWKPTLLIIVLALVLSLMFATIVSLPLTLLTSFGGLAIGTAIYSKESSYQTWAKGTIGFIIGLLLVFVSAQLLLGINWTTELDTIIEESLVTSESIMQQLGFTDQVEEQMALITEQMKNLLLLIPAVITIISIVLSLITTFLSYKIINRVDKEKYYFTPFRDFNLPMSVFWIYFLVIILSFFNNDITTTMGTVIANGMVILTSLIILQGFSFIFHYADKKRWPKAIPIIIIIISFLIPFILMLVIQFLGIIDLGFGLKKRVSSQDK